jgi:hypothetical protein
MLRVMGKALACAVTLTLGVTVAGHFVSAQVGAAPSALPALFAEGVRKLTAANSNDQRFDVMTQLLETRGVPFTVEPFRSRSRWNANPVRRAAISSVTIGEGPEDLIIGAHYDAPRLRDGSLSPGAVDNAASSVMLVDLAASLRSGRFPLRIRLLWFDMEELGFIGSSRYVTAHRGDRICITSH